MVVVVVVVLVVLVARNHDLKPQDFFRLWLVVMKSSVKQSRSRSCSISK